MPNTKTKKFDFQVFLAVFLILLVICCATVCCVIGNTEKGVADADEPVYDTWDVTGGFYTKKITNMSDFQSIINYYFGFIPETQNPKIASYVIGKLRFNYVNTSNSFETVDLLISVCLEPLDVYNSFVIKLHDTSMENTVNFITIVDLDSVIYTINYWESYATTSTDNAYFYSFEGDWTNPSNFLHQFLTFALGSVSNFKSLESFTFSTYSSIRWVVNQTETFDNVPIPSGSYDDGYNDAVNELQPTIDELRQENSQLQTELDRYETILEYTNWFTFIDSSYNNVRSSSFNGMKTTMRQNVEIDGNNGVYLSDTTGTAQGLICLLDFGTTLAEGTKVRFTWKDLMIGYQSGSSGPGAFLPVHLAVLSNGALIDCYVTTEDTRLDGSCEFELPVDAHGIYLYNSIATTYIFISAMTGEYYSYNPEEVYDSGYNNGFEVGKSQGIQLGRQEGYNQGVLDANDYSFFGLFTAVFDAPITAIVGRWGDSDGDGVYQREGGMLNFYIPGLEINFAPFLLSMFTIAIIVMIIRFILARKS